MTKQLLWRQAKTRFGLTRQAVRRRLSDPRDRHGVSAIRRFDDP